MKLKKILLSKKGQLSMEMGIIVTSAVLVGIIVSFYYIKNVKETEMEATGKKAINATKTMTEKADQYCKSIEST